ncbi:adenylate/guanylate cyclase domain-containing protein [Sandarakinorhabdus limnophila]|uniref:adenylate/guanylate cyclase domain-containing protein n=1 Tax=Sandarakinorhabdus limnophila TaxID=210512 RepID=UPI0026F255C3|nr:adenylate/guanylate cyclase domain-containing protein [Sandarakinorhabdus limnophila]MCM0032141.1 adenylate/guanylate cyclase domain-containing protein [Sandarakinorhabdus limnophila]
MSKAQKQALSAALIAIFAAVAALCAVRFLAPLTNLENKVADIRVAAMQPAMAPSTDIVVVAINEDTLTAFPYRSPVDRGFLADVISQVSAKGARVIGVDIIIDQPTEATKDARLKQVLTTTPTPLFLSYTSSPNIVTPEQLAFLNDFVPANQRAEANLLSDPFDTLIRRINPGGELKNGRMVDTASHPAGFVRKAVTLFGGTAPLTPVEIAWRPRPDAESLPFPSFPAQFVSILPDEFFRGKIVLIGATLSITDRHMTPMSIIDDGDQGNMPGVFVQAHGISQLLENRAPPRMPLGGVIAFSALFAALGVAVSLFKRGIIFNVGVGVAILASYWVGAIVGFGYGLPMLPIIGPSIAFALSIWMMDVFIGRAERKQREFVQGTFSRYVSPAIVDKLVKDPTSVTISGERQEATFIFTDIAGFTTTSEQMKAEDLSNVLNDYLDGACEIILRYEGTIDKFIGDAIMAIFNAPIRQPDHAERAVRCALELDAYAEKFRKDCNSRDIPIGVTRIGVHTGYAVIGNFGSHARMDFTALGDTVNTAARTEGVNKYFGTRICCTSDTVDLCPNLHFRQIGDIVLKGKTTASALYNPIAETDDPKLIQEYDEAYKLLTKECGSAKAAFDDIAEAFPNDPIVQFHIGRISKNIISARVVMDDK